MRTFETLINEALYHTDEAGSCETKFASVETQIAIAYATIAVAQELHNVAQELHKINEREEVKEIDHSYDVGYLD